MDWLDAMDHCVSDLVAMGAPLDPNRTRFIELRPHTSRREVRRQYRKSYDYDLEDALSHLMLGVRTCPLCFGLYSEDGTHECAYRLVFD